MSGSAYAAAYPWKSLVVGAVRLDEPHYAVVRSESGQVVAMFASAQAAHQTRLKFVMRFIGTRYDVRPVAISTVRSPTPPGKGASDGDV